MAAKQQGKEIESHDEFPLRWPKGWQRTGLDRIRPMKAWKKPFSYYRDLLVRELQKSGATKVVITLNRFDDARKDPGVSIYFWKSVKEDFSWQLALGIDNPAPTLDEIDSAYRKKILEHHPDRLGEAATTKDAEIVKSLAIHRANARNWVLGTRSDRPFELPCDRFSEQRWNLNALRLGIASLRRLDDYGLPGLLERAAQPDMLTAGETGGAAAGAAGDTDGGAESDVNKTVVA